MMALLLCAVFAQNENLAKLEFLVGTWRGSGEFQGEKFSDEYVYEWAQNKNFLRWRYSMSMGGKVVWQDEGMMGWDAEKKKIVAFCFGMDGTIGRAECVESTKDKWVMEGTSTGPYKEFRCTIERTAEDEFLSSCEMKELAVYTTRYKKVRKP